MEPLVTNKRFLILFCGCSADEKIVNWQKWVNWTFTLTTFIGFIFGIYASVGFFFAHVSIDLEKSLYAIFQISAMGCAAYLIVFVYFSRRKIAHVFDDLREIYRKSKWIRSFSRSFQYELKSIIFDSMSLCINEFK